MEPLRQLRADDLVEVLRAARTSMAAHAPGLDRLDEAATESGPGSGDTGRHLAETLDAVVAGLGMGGTLTELAADLGRSSTLGVGASGRLLAAFLGGFGELCRNADALDPLRLAMAFEAGSDAVLEQLGDPRPGALPAVAAEVAEVALRCADEAAPLPEMLIEAADRGLDALELTPSQWGPLAEAGVVDAGGAGFLVLIDAFVAVVHGDDPEPPAWEFPEHADPDGELYADEGFRFEVTLRLAPDVGAPSHAGDVGVMAELLARVWRGLGDEVRADAGPDAVDAKVCTDDIGAVIESALQLGRPTDIVVLDRRG